MNQPIVIIGGDAAGMTAASKLKRATPATEVIVFDRGQDISYSACGLPYWLAGVVESDRRLIVLTPEMARESRGIDVRIQHEVLAINRSAKTVSVRSLVTGKLFEQPYAKLVIATGARATRPPIPGTDLPGVFTLRTLQEARQIFDYMADQLPQRAIIIGGGYIGMEMAETLRDRHLAVTLLQKSPQIMTSFDHEMVEAVMTHLAEQQVQVRTNTQVTAIETSGDQLQVITAETPALATDMVIMAAGVRPNSELAVAAGLRIGATQAIWVNEQMQTSDPDIYAAGDCVEHYHRVLEKNVWIPLATSAIKGGRVVGENLSGTFATFPGILGTTVVKVFDYTLAVTGLTEKQAKASGNFGALGEDVGSTVISHDDKVGYWPGAQPIKVKLIFEKSSGRVLGGQLVGKAGVNKRIDIVATAITARMTLSDLSMLDLSYAPPYSPTWDPIQVCANVALRG
ncbi:MAG: FAD-dependent oxidoreductase [Chloroflexi bacterium]|nr:FAD-dependent oxidoreductase [Chloroflexota bacterium]